MKLLTVLVLVTTCACSRLGAQTNTTTEATVPLHHDVEEVTRTIMDEQHLPGVAVVIVKDGKTIFKRGYGVANIEKRTEVDPDSTLFRIGSISKALTLLTLTRLIGDGRLTRDDDVASYFEGIQNPYGFQQPVTMEHLLTHTSGFDQIGGSDRQVLDFNLTLAERKAQRSDIGSYLADNKLRRVSEPGAYFRYDTYGSTLAGAVIERVTGLPYRTAMQREMFGPLGMTRTSVEVDSKHLGDLAVGYGFVNGAYVPQPYEVFVTTPASSIDSTPADMARLLEALTNGGANAHGRLFDAATAEAALAPQFRPHPEFVGMTHGLFESYSQGGEKRVRSVGHGGSMRGYIAALLIVPEFNVGIFVATNRAPEAGGGPVDLEPIFETVIGNLPNVPNHEPYPVPERIDDRNLSEYVGDYYYGVYCHTCSAEEIENRGWRRGPSRAVRAENGALIISERAYLPRGDDVFVRSDGRRMVYFGRDEAGRVTFYVFITSPDTFERELDTRPYREILSLAQAVLEVTNKDGIEAALKLVNDAKESGDYYFREDEMNDAGYALLQAAKTKEAIEVFKLNVSQFPDSWNAYDSLGEAYANNGNKQLALDNYEKSIELNPENTGGIAMVSKLRGE